VLRSLGWLSFSLSLFSCRLTELLSCRYAIEAFRDGRYDVLVATDVAGRGLDVKGVKHVINYDMPQKIEGAYSPRLANIIPLSFSLSSL
jgi:hypothetical protein